MTGIKTVNTYLWCAVIILTFFIIVQFTLKHCENKMLADQFTFASTISSIILSVIAIIMSVVSSDSINNLLHKFRDLHDAIKDTPHRIDSSLESMKTVSDHFEEAKNEINQTICKLNSNVCDISSATDEMKLILTKIDASISGMDKKVSTGIDEIKKNMNLTIPTKRGDDNNSTFSSSIDKHFLNLCPNAALHLLYAIYFSKEQKKVLNINLLASIVIGLDKLSGAYYYWGFLMSLNTSSLVAIKEIGERVGKEMDDVSIFDYAITNINVTIDDINEEFSTRIEKRTIQDYRQQIDNMINDASSIPE